MQQSIEQFLMSNLISNTNETEDIFIHGFRLPDDVNIEDFSKKLFEEGIKKQSRDSILSTIKLLMPNKPLDKQIENYVLHGKFRVILKIPESLNELYLGKCKRKFEDAGNQYDKNSLLDFLELDHIPSEFIVGIVYTDKETYAEGEEINYKFIKNPNYFEDLVNYEKNTQKLENKIKSAEGSEIAKKIMAGQELPDKLKEMLSSLQTSNNYDYFIKQQEEYLANKDSLSI